MANQEFTLKIKRPGCSAVNYTVWAQTVNEATQRSDDIADGHLGQGFEGRGTWTADEASGGFLKQKRGRYTMRLRRA